ncbi:MAG: UDP-N-acetylmuramoyl-tripeptide--D-alanyl-D-alanine ligase [Alphaproteobacteria bacterium]|nr:UDP-N-acetylmuramoyl-tripeptide--D-alanyl-D-alanine ligase [Alphaproteobacteria bacterium]MBU6471506.1 UDP-N-acetylmuramoyl-tripeptide--D-alanyl-D-alanine ligase [Alphaproteobacteria bacterium]MDE2012391.1 UDP-N-acetylmuramoyl-tripeptide--D-alanyl-D-alanine ligase [Alphaproteobacteria bacterium]MDE2073119.1 UDP-N-acetylmuramoyl-tripeptide--D-alanyl-D-alanine ligase [Alphaproteobacteria bacterium]MDE2353200.1 UDP-N-acetylmuramoyl-tripeptide--D-alanyl-D-alanine ligase [Alphaproteobacteria bact
MSAPKNPLWTSAEAEAATLGTASRAFEATGISIDTRTLKPGDLFVALQGEARDGHAFVRAAFEAGAGAALVSNAPDDLPPDAALLTVAHTQRGLEDLGRAARARSHGKVIAVTGSAGKTTTKEMLRLAFGALGRTHASAASYNNHWGVPLTLAAMPRDCEYAVIEIGMNHFGEIRALGDFARPHVALVTTIAPAHLEFFGSAEAIADAKSEIFEHIVPGGAAAIPADNPHAGRLVQRAKQAGLSTLLRFGTAPGCEARLIAREETAEGQRIEADILGRAVHVHVGAPGAHIAQNAVGALAVVAAADGDVLNAAAALSQFSALKGRGAQFRVRVGAGEATVIDESYNANPASMAAALALLGSARVPGRRIVVLGDMLEMGPESAAHHAALAGDIEAAKVDLVFANGAQMKALWDRLPASRRGAYGATSAEIVPALDAALADGDVVLVKGSFGSKMAVVIEALKARGAG